MEFIDLIRTPNIDGVRLLDKNGQVDCQGKIAITGHQLLFVAREKELIMDHKMVDAVEKDTDKGRNLVKMRQKNGKMVRFLLNSQGEADDLCTSVQLCGMIKFTDTHPFYFNPPRSYEQLSKPNVLGTQAWFATLRNKRWRLFEKNHNFEICPTYPKFVVVPAAVKDDLIVKSAKFRDGARFPVLSALIAVGEQKQKIHNPLLRCSSIGFMEARNKQDEEILRLISNGQKSVLIDIRSKSMITELKNKRKGIETDSYYPLYKKEYPDLMNRYSVHNSFCKAWEAMSSKSDDFLDKLRKSGWLAAVDTTLWVASLTAQAVRQAPVIVHGGDGIDMTLVVTSLTQIILLPEARTLVGLLSIIQREWIEAGHPFFERHQRSAWTQKNAITGQEGSTFFLFLHAIQHLLLTHPLHFEFNSSFLLRLHDIAVSSEFGNFIGDNEKERARAGVANKTYSIWPILASEESFKNPLFGETQMKPAWPLGPSDLWRQYWCRFQRASSTQKDDIFDLQMASLKKLKTENEALKLRMTELAQLQRAAR